jgi:PUA domain protein
MARIPAKLPPERLKKKQTVPVSTVQKLKRSAAEYMPGIPSIQDSLFPKKKPLTSYSLEDRVVVYAVGDPPRPILIQFGNQQVIPHLRLAIDYPGLLRPVYVDDGAVRALLRGADLMAPGIKKAPEPFDAGSVLEVRLLDTNVPFAIGIAQIGSADITPSTKGEAIHIVHILKDGLWEHRDGVNT